MRADKVLALLEGGGGTTSFELVLTQELKVLAIVKGEAKSPFKGVVQTVLLCFGGGGAQQVSD